MSVVKSRGNSEGSNLNNLPNIKNISLGVLAVGGLSALLYLGYRKWCPLSNKSKNDDDNKSTNDGEVNRSSKVEEDNLNNDNETEGDENDKEDKCVCDLQQ